jgi:hypothetical protein
VDLCCCAEREFAIHDYLGNNSSRRLDTDARIIVMRAEGRGSSETSLIRRPKQISIWQYSTLLFLGDDKTAPP